MHDEREWYEGRLCVWAAGPKELQEALVSGAPERFFVPPYVGHRGWVGLRLDLPEVDWDEVAGVVEDAHAYVVDRWSARASSECLRVLHSLVFDSRSPHRESHPVSFTCGGC